MIMAARILIDTLALLTGPMAPETCPEEGFEFRFHADDDDSSLNVIPDDDDDQLRSCCVPANFNFHSKCILCLCKYINLNANSVAGRERERQQQKNFLRRTNFQRSRPTKWRSLRVGVATGRRVMGGMWGVTFGQCPALPGEALVGLRGSFRMPLGRPM